MRLVQVSPTYAPCVGGAERLLQAVSERLAARGHEVTVLTLDCASQRDFGSPAGARLPPSEQRNGVRIIRVNPSGGPLHRMHRWWLRRRGGWRTTTWLMGPDFEFHFGTPSGLGTIMPLLRLKADLITSVNWHYGVSYWALWSSRLCRTPHVGVPLLHIDRPWANRRAYPGMFRNCAAVIACTEAEGEFARARGARSTAVAGAGVEPTAFANRNGAAIRTRYGLGMRPVVGFIGRQDELKGVLTVIEAMRRVWLHIPETILLLAGQKAHRGQEVTAELEALSSSERENLVLIDDFADTEGPSILDACDLLAQPSVEEAFGLVLVEAWMCGKPVIGANIAATRSVIWDGIDGWLVKPGDPADLASRILGLLADPETRAAFGQRGREKVLSRYTWDRVTDAWEATYRSVLRT